ncbi:hypothetical protein AIOL_001273 [Candidatus Rhodobacter oscarellae]|uniref:Uncharacterized protein n=2 Tax=Candidatus Rhodobacter oscarellae TaxID=1675527 RepID=A0A0J9E053_9RHOB|nr:hypothetical protein AIOL_001273 [Candidatus Rhodobacter lobularis]
MICAALPVAAHDYPPPKQLPPEMMRVDPNSAITLFGEAVGLEHMCKGHKKQVRQMACDQATARCEYLRGRASKPRVVKAGVILARGAEGCYYAKAAVTCKFGTAK